MDFVKGTPIVRHVLEDLGARHQVEGAVAVGEPLDVLALHPAVEGSRRHAVEELGDGHVREAPAQVTAEGAARGELVHACAGRDGEPVQHDPDRAMAKGGQTAHAAAAGRARMQPEHGEPAEVAGRHALSGRGR